MDLYARVSLKTSWERFVLSLTEGPNSQRIVTQNFISIAFKAARAADSSAKYEERIFIQEPYLPPLQAVHQRLQPGLQQRQNPRNGRARETSQQRWNFDRCHRYSDASLGMFENG